MQQLIQSKTFKIAAAVFGSLFALLLAFAGGVKVGLHKANFSGNFNKHYEENFAGRGRDNDDRGGRGGRGSEEGRGMMGAQGGGMMDLGGDFRNGHGTAGDIVSISGDTVVLKNKNNQEVSVRISSESIINKGQDEIAIGDLKAGDHVVVVGKPGDDGVIAALIVRVFPTPQMLQVEGSPRMPAQTQGGTQPDNQSQVKIDNQSIQNEVE